MINSRFLGVAMKNPGDQPWLIANFKRRHSRRNCIDILTMTTKGSQGNGSGCADLASTTAESELIRPAIPRQKNPWVFVEDGKAA